MRPLTAAALPLRAPATAQASKVLAGSGAHAQSVTHQPSLVARGSPDNCPGAGRAGPVAPLPACGPRRRELPRPCTLGWSSLACLLPRPVLGAAGLPLGQPLQASMERRVRKPFLSRRPQRPVLRGWAAPPAVSITRGAAPRTSSWMWGYSAPLIAPHFLVECSSRNVVALP